jgi:uncharacterized membrane protein
MTHSSKKNRIIFIDLLRAFAVLQMVQGHTTDVLLADSYRDLTNPLFSVWHFMRGMTAPIFLFTAGTVFTYLFRLVKIPFNDNPRVLKGIKRSLLLVALGYLLRYPTPTIVDFSGVSDLSWTIFLAVDVLQLIGISLFFIILLAYLSEKIRSNDYLIFGAAAVLFFAIYPLFERIEWLNIFPHFIASYFYSGTGSQFPLFPWAGYVIAGGVLGSYLAKNPMIFKTPIFSLKLGIAGGIILLLSFAGDMLYDSNQANYWLRDYNIIMLRFGFVLMLTSFVSLISLTINSIPKFLILVGRNTLLIYIVHLMILYGSAWNPGLNHAFGKTFTAWETFVSAAGMLALMMGLVLLINKLRIKNKQLVTQ